MGYEWLIGARYLRSEHRSGLVSFVASMSVLGLTLGVAVLIVVLSVLNGFAGAYPNVFLVVDAKELPGFVDAVRGLASGADAARLLDRYGLRRSDPRFWAHSDALHAAYRRWAPKEAGQFDYNRYGNW